MVQKKIVFSSLIITPCPALVIKNKKTCHSLETRNIMAQIKNFGLLLIGVLLLLVLEENGTKDDLNFLEV